VRAIHRHARGRLIDYAIVNVRSISGALKRRYAQEDALPVEIDIDALIRMGCKVTAGSLASSEGKVRHDPAATASVIVRLAQEARKRAARA
jgi:2-phospho-L-lactate transferase/gluconeogenesis factor (CofD/UPF0052 family)